MSFSGRRLALSVWMAVMFTYLNVRLRGVEVRMGGMCRHAKKCWGAETVKSAYGTKDLEAARAILLKTNLHDGTIMAEFERIGRGKVTYSHRQHTSTEAR